MSLLVSDAAHCFQRSVTRCYSLLPCSCYWKGRCLVPGIGVGLEIAVGGPSVAPVMQRCCIHQL